MVGFDEGVNYHDLAFACLCLLENPGCKLVATNLDFQYPARGRFLPGNGAIVAAIKTGSRREPDVASRARATAQN